MGICTSVGAVALLSGYDFNAGTIATITTGLSVSYCLAYLTPGTASAC